MRASVTTIRRLVSGALLIVVAVAMSWTVTMRISGAPEACTSCGVGSLYGCSCGVSGAWLEQPVPADQSALLSEGRLVLPDLKVLQPDSTPLFTSAWRPTFETLDPQRVRVRKCSSLVNMHIRLQI